MIISIFVSTFISKTNLLILRQRTDTDSNDQQDIPKVKRHQTHRYDFLF